MVELRELELEELMQKFKIEKEKQSIIDGFFDDDQKSLIQEMTLKNLEFITNQDLNEQKKSNGVDVTELVDRKMTLNQGKKEYDNEEKNKNNNIDEEKQNTNNSQQSSENILKKDSINCNISNDNISVSKVTEEIAKIRIGNTLCNPQKDLIELIRNNWNNIMDLAFDKELGNLARTLSTDIKPVAASKKNLILVAKLNGLSSQINNNIDDIEKIILKAININVKCICLAEQEWKKYIDIYKNDKNIFKYKEEPNNVESKKTLKEKAKELFEN